jgi:hypothetical protein
MSPMMKRLYRTIVRERDFGCFQEKVNAEEVIKSYCSALDLDVCQVLREWTGVPGAGARKRTPPPLRSDDDLPTDDDDNDVVPEPETVLCPACRGLGRAKDGSKCERCGGSGRVRDDGDGNDYDDEDNFDRKIFSYEEE